MKEEFRVLTNDSMPTVMEIGIGAYMEVMVVESGKDMSWLNQVLTESPVT